MAVAAAPYVHARPQAPPRVRTNPMDSSPIKSTPNSTVVIVEERLSPESSTEKGLALNPLSFLLGIMRDPDATPEQRMRAARVAARYKHVSVPPDKMPAVDEYGFSISRALAKAIADDWLRLELLQSGRLGAETADYVDEASRIHARQAERDKFLECVPGYSPEKDFQRQTELLNKRRRDKLSMSEHTELAYVLARTTAYGARFNRTPEGRARNRAGQLTARKWMRAAGRAKPLGLTAAEESELKRLYEEFPSLAPVPLCLD
jgi:hypothetical protein